RHGERLSGPALARPGPGDRGPAAAGRGARRAHDARPGGGRRAGYALLPGDDRDPGPGHPGRGAHADPRGRAHGEHGAARRGQRAAGQLPDEGRQRPRARPRGRPLTWPAGCWQAGPERLVVGLIVDLGLGRVGLDGGDAVEGGLLALVGLTGGDDLAVRRVQVEVVLAAGAPFEDELAGHATPWVDIVYSRILASGTGRRQPTGPAGP